jgi:hypothetical protein
MRWPQIKADSHGNLAERTLERWLKWRSMGREYPDVLGRSWNVEVRRLDHEAEAMQRAAEFHCEAWFCRRPDTHRALFDFRRLFGDGQVLGGETFFCTKHAMRYARRRGVAILPPDSDPKGHAAP